LENVQLVVHPKKQAIVATLTTEAEYISTSECNKKVLLFKNIFKEILNFDKT